MRKYLVVVLNIGTAFEESNGNLETCLSDSRMFNVYENPDHPKLYIGSAHVQPTAV